MPTGRRAGELTDARRRLRDRRGRETRSNGARAYGIGRRPLLASCPARVLIDDFHRIRHLTAPHRHALYAWVPPSPRVRCRKAFVTYLLARRPGRAKSSLIFLSLSTVRNSTVQLRSTRTPYSRVDYSNILPQTARAHRCVTHDQVSGPLSQRQLNRNVKFSERHAHGSERADRRN